MLPNGQHRWVATAAPSGDVVAGTSAPLAYASPQPNARRWWTAPVAFLTGLPTGAVGFTGAIATLWQSVFKSSPTPVLFAACIATAIGGGFCLGYSRRFLGWLAFGTSFGLLLTTLLTFLFWGWRDC